MLNMPSHIAIAGLLFLFIVLMTPGLRGFEGDLYSWNKWACITVQLRTVCTAFCLLLA